MKINNEDLLKFQKFNPVISKLNLLIKLIEENLYEENISYQLFNPNITNILSSILIFEEKRNKKTLIDLIRNISQSLEYIDLIYNIFPYNKFKDSNLDEIVYFIPLIKDIYKSNVPLQINVFNSTFNFIEKKEETNFKIKLYLIIKKDSEGSHLLLDEKTETCFNFKNVEKKHYNFILNKKNVNVKKTKEFIKLIINIIFILNKYNEDIEEGKFHTIFGNENIDEKKKYFYFQKLFPFNEDNPFLIPKIWSIIYNFYNTLPIFSEKNQNFSIHEFNNINPINTYYIQG